MLKIRRIISMVLVITMLACCLASCGGRDPDKLIPKAEEALDSAPYVMNVRIKYESDDEQMREVIDSFSNPAIKVSVDGDDFIADMDVKKDGVWNYMTYTFVDGTLYTEWNENGKVVQYKEEYSDTDRSALKLALGDGATVSADDFEDVSVKNVGKLSVITCKKIKDAALASLVASLEEQLTSLKADVAIKDATLDIEIEDGKYNGIILTCEYYITTSLDSYAITMTYSTQFSYEDVEITAPVFD